MSDPTWQWTSGIESVVADVESNNGKVEIYDLSGRKMSPDRVLKGIYLVHQGSTTKKVLYRN